MTTKTAGYGIRLGGGEPGPGDRKLIIPPQSPFADIAALNAWASADPMQLRNSFGEDAQVTTVVVTDNTGMPDTSSNTYLWSGDDEPTTYSVNNWVVSSGVTPTDLKDLLESLPNTNFTTDRQLGLLEGFEIIDGRAVPALSFTSGVESAPARVIGEDLHLLNVPYFEETGYNLGRNIQIFENNGFIGVKSVYDTTLYNTPSYLTPYDATSSRVRRLATTTASATREVLAPGSGTLSGALLVFSYDHTGIESVNQITFTAASDLTNFRMSIIDTDTGEVVKYYPDRQVWDTGSGGIDFSTGPVLIDLRDSPLYLQSKTYDLSIRYEGGELVESVEVGKPAFSVTAQDVEIIESQDTLTQVNVTAVSGVDIQGEVNQSLSLDLVDLSNDNAVVLLPVNPNIKDVYRIRQIDNIGTNSLTIKNGASGLINLQLSSGTVDSDNEFITRKSRLLDFEYTSAGWFLYEL